MRPKIIYANSDGIDTIINGVPRIKECCDITEYLPKKSGPDILGRREFVRRLGGLLVPITLGGLLVPRGAEAGTTTITRTISAATETAAQITNGTFARQLLLPSGWNKVRVAMRMHWTDPGADMTCTPTLAIGLCSGTSNQFGDATTTHFVGMIIAAAGWTRWGGSPQQWMVGNPGQYFACVRIGTTNTLSAVLIGGGANSLLPAGALANAADRGLVFIDITKGTPNYTFQMPFGNIGSAQTDFSSAQFLLYAAQATFGSGNPPGYVSVVDGWVPARTLAVSESTNGTLNAVNFCWNRTDSLIEICDVAVSVLA